VFDDGLSRCQPARDFHSFPRICSSRRVVRRGPGHYKPAPEHRAAQTVGRERWGDEPMDPSASRRRQGNSLGDATRLDFGLHRGLVAIAVSTGAMEALSGLTTQPGRSDPTRLS
jgi:hypothetical protein